MVSQHYDTDVNKAYVIRGNAAILKCEIPSFVADFVSVVSWHTDKDEAYFPGSDYGWSIRESEFYQFHLYNNLSFCACECGFPFHEKQYRRAVNNSRSRESD